MLAHVRILLVHDELSPDQGGSPEQKSRTKEYDLNVFHDRLILFGKRK